MKTGTTVKTDNFVNETGVVAMKCESGVACASFARVRSGSVREEAGFVMRMGDDLAIMLAGKRGRERCERTKSLQVRRLVECEM